MEEASLEALSRDQEVLFTFSATALAQFGMFVTTIYSILCTELIKRFVFN